MVRKSDERVITSTGNVFADIELHQPDEALAKARIVETISELLLSRSINQKEAGRLVGLTQPQVSRLMRGDTREFSYERLMRVLTALGQDVDITIRQTRGRSRRGRVLVHG